MKAIILTAATLLTYITGYSQTDRRIDTSSVNSNRIDNIGNNTRDRSINNNVQRQDTRPIGTINNTNTGTINSGTINNGTNTNPNSNTPTNGTYNNGNGTNNNNNTGTFDRGNGNNNSSNTDRTNSNLNNR